VKELSSTHPPILKVLFSKLGQREPARNILNPLLFPVFAPLQCDNFQNLARCGSAALDISTLSAQYLSDIQSVGCSKWA
jgi:hypothetical protein